MTEILSTEIYAKITSNVLNELQVLIGIQKPKLGVNGLSFNLRNVVFECNIDLKVLADRFSMTCVKYTFLSDDILLYTLGKDDYIICTDKDGFELVNKVRPKPYMRVRNSKSLVDNQRYLAIRELDTDKFYTDNLEDLRGIFTKFIIGKLTIRNKNFLNLKYTENIFYLANIQELIIDNCTFGLVRTHELLETNFHECQIYKVTISNCTFTNLKLLDTVFSWMCKIDELVIQNCNFPELMSVNDIFDGMSKAKKIIIEGCAFPSLKLTNECMNTVFAFLSVDNLVIKGCRFVELSESEKESLKLYGTKIFNYSSIEHFETDNSDLLLSYEIFKQKVINQE